LNETSMFNFYVSTALRHLLRHKITTAINIACLWFGLAAFTIAYGINAVYWQMDRHHANVDRTYFVSQDSRFGSGAVTSGPVVASGTAIGPLLKVEFPDLEHVVRISLPANTAVAAGGEKLFGRVSYADPDMLDVIDLEYVAGDRNALQAPRSAIVSEQFAQLLFKDRNPLGQRVLLNNDTEVHITAVIRSSQKPTLVSACCEANGSWFPFSMLVDWDTRAALHSARDTTGRALDPFFRDSAITYVVFKEQSELTPEVLRGHLAAFSREHVPADHGTAIFDLKPMTEAVVAVINSGVQTHRSGLSFATLVFGSGLLILGVACLNYANLASAQAATRTKELALLRTVGASRAQIIAQVFFESLLAVTAATLLLTLSLPFIVTTLLGAVGGGIDYSLYVTKSLAYWQWLAIAIGVTALGASAYPALVMTRVRPANALHSGRVPVRNRRVMTWIVIGQCVMASALLVFTDIMGKQNEASSRGFEGTKNSLLLIRNDLPAIQVDPIALKNELRMQSVVQSVGAANGLIGSGFPGRIVMTGREPSSQTFVPMAPTVDEGFFESAGIDIVAGRNFDNSIASDLATDELHGNVIIDTAMAVRFGWKNPQDAIGKEIFVPASAAPNAVGMPRRVIGVVESKALTPYASGTDAMQLYSFNPKLAVTVIVRLRQVESTGTMSRGDATASNSVKAGIDAVTATWDRLVLTTPLSRMFADEAFGQSMGGYSALGFAGRVLGYLSLLIASMGIMAVAIHAVAQRTFEIGVRKALGARFSQILVMLLKDFSKPIVLANLIAWPFAYILGKGYTTLFTNQVSVTAWPFLSSLIVGLLIAWLAVGRQAWRAGRMNPATVLRYE
jgi:putative ABC transport system permease protein